MGEYLTVRASQVNRYNDCPRSNAVRFIPNEIEAAGHVLAPTRNSIAVAIGNGVHGMMAELFKQKMGLGRMMLNSAFEAREKTFEESLLGELIWDATTPHIDAAKAQLKALCGAFLPLAEFIQPVAVEDELSWDVSPLGHEAVPIKLVGHRDVKDNRNEIHDHKTGSEFPSCWAQGGCYAILSMYHGEEVSAFRVNYAPRLPVGKLHEIQIRSVRLPLDECIAAAWNTLRDIQLHYMRWLETKDPWSFPPNPYSQCCNERYCSVFNSTFCKVGSCV